MSEEFTGVLADLRNISQKCMVPNWGGDNEAAITEGVLAAAILLGTRLKPEPFIEPEPDGNISLEWYVEPRRVLSVSIGDDGGSIMAWCASLIGRAVWKAPLSITQALEQLPKRIMDVETTHLDTYLQQLRDKRHEKGKAARETHRKWREWKDRNENQGRKKGGNSGSQLRRAAPDPNATKSDCQSAQANLSSPMVAEV